jgi:hypothetical protein
MQKIKYAKYAKQYAKQCAVKYEKYAIYVHIVV